MKHIIRVFLLVLILSLAYFLVQPSEVSCQDKPLEIRLVTLAPMGTSPHVALLKMGEKWQKLSGVRSNSQSLAATVPEEKQLWLTRWALVA